MKILITNDDGIYSKGIYSLYVALNNIGEVYVVAPVTEQSAVGHAITINNPLKITNIYRKNKHFGVGVYGTPADCVKLAINDLLDSKVDLVVSGINHGANLCNNIIYSGTVSAATEASMLGVPSFAISLASLKYIDFEAAAQFAAFFSEFILTLKLGNGTVFNVNVPPISKHEIKGWKLTVQGKTRYNDTFEKRHDPKGNVYYWMVGEKLEPVEIEDGDDFTVKNGYISVTPLHYDLCDYNTFKKLKEMGVGGKSF